MPLLALWGLMASLTSFEPETAEPPSEPSISGHQDSINMHEIASPLLALLPEQDLAVATPLYVEVILPVELRGLESHPKPERYKELVLTALGDELRTQAPRSRMDTVRMQALRAQFRQMNHVALQLGVARYLLAHPEAVDQAGHWFTPEAQAWMTRGQDEVVLEAVEQLNALERWGEQTQVTHPKLHTAEEGSWMQARLTLQSVVSGSFETSGGSMVDFIRAVGGESESIRLGG